MATSIEVPRRLPLLLVADNVLLPGSSMRIPVRSLRNMNMVKSRLLRHSTLGSTIIGVVLKEPGIETDEFTLHPIGTAAVAVQVTGTNWPEPAYTLLVTGLCRFKIEELLQETPYPVARVAQLENIPADDNDDLKKKVELGDLMDTFREHAMELVNMLDVSVPVVAKLKKLLDNVPSQQLPDICVSIVKASLAEKVQVLDAVDLAERFKKTLPLLMRQIEGLKLLQKSHAHKLTIAPRKPSRGKTLNIRKALEKLEEGKNKEEMEELDEIEELENKLKVVGLTPAADKAASRELKRLKNMPQQMPEHAMIRNYLELMVELPWNKTTTDSLDIAQARKDLDTDHYGLDKLKRRVIEYLAVRQLKNTLKGPILCFVGPPGVGKTSIGRSIAQTLGREFHRIALGGVCDQSDVRGHRRTYIGSMPGRIIQGLKLVGVKNPVFLLDEIDKLGTSLHGDPAAALLEVLDPEQNHAFVDHYLNVPFDLSQVLFIATANTTMTVPAALLDRMELIQIPGYTYDEKTHIAMRHLIPKQLGEHGLHSDTIQIPEDTVKVIVSDYTREAGVRTLERQIAAVCRAVAVRVTEYNTRKRAPPGGEMGEKKAPPSSEMGEKKAPPSSEMGEKKAPPGGEMGEKKTAGESKDAGEVVDVVDASAMSLPPEMPIVIDEHALEDILGPSMYESETSERLSQPGVAVGLAWTVLGGEIMFVEATKMEGEGKLTLTGQLGDVMKESASLALNWVRSHAGQLDIQTPRRDLLENTDIHIHFPAGAVMKDGPSAGVTIVTVLVSLFTGRCVRSDTAMTGEVTLRGLVLAIGGVKAKVLAAHRAGISRVILPRRNEKDLHEVPANIKKELSFVLASRLEDVLEAAFDNGFPKLKVTSPLLPSKI